ncbi:hypothetical protein [Streptomyces longispororuber]|uniref:hypothetical protein n=1 Tax=Streptomyces longispororuber TaxID=68230 RepID=UPI00210AA91C|nr:hypothetical protein [Streptomyces longispororuber]MCQ4214004.1 hypothetical protein [Streptomyces longispororuber]
MSAATSTAAPGRRARAWARALLLAVALLVTPLAAPAAEAAPPAAASSCEPGELHQDTAENALRLPTGHPVRLPTAPPRQPRPPFAPWARTSPEHPASPSHRALRTVVLRC